VSQSIRSPLGDVAIEARSIALRWSDGRRRVVPFAWLRDSCACPACRHPGSGQRLLEPAAIPHDIHPAEAHLDGDDLLVVWAPDRHLSTYAGAWLRDRGGEPLARPVRLWDASIGRDLPLADHAAIAGDPRQLGRWLRLVDELGFGVLSGVPVADREVARVASLFAHVRTTNYGRVFDVRSVVEPANLANTSLGLGAHTDNPYRDPVPTLQLLHCLSSSARGGESTLVDGFCIADHLRTERPGDFAVLSGHSVAFSYRDATTSLRAAAPIIELDPDGNVRGIRFNARSMEPPAMAAPELVAWYDAYLHLARMLADESFQLQLRLEPGDLFIVDNRRVLHGRAPYAASGGERHLQGCYADIDGMRSTLAVLEQGDDDA
jgi:gamma-butyrobetaine dioxygenase